jgi:hypothetical protein
MLRLGALLKSRLAERAWWLLVVAGIAVLIALAAHPARVGPVQPLPFSHKLHAGDKQISCLFCHTGADRSSDAGLPEVQKCLLCHNTIAIGLEPIERLHERADNDDAIPWVRVYRLPDYVFFNHAAHVRKNVDCSVCHGNVKEMDRIVLNQKLEMGFCVDCHRQPQYKASVDCSRCHR